MSASKSVSRYPKIRQPVGWTRERTPKKSDFPHRWIRHASGDVIAITREVTSGIGGQGTHRYSYAVTDGDARVLDTCVNGHEAYMCAYAFMERVNLGEPIIGKLLHAERVTTRPQHTRMTRKNHKPAKRKAVKFSELKLPCPQCAEMLRYERGRWYCDTDSCGFICAKYHRTAQMFHSVRTDATHAVPKSFRHPLSQREIQTKLMKRIIDIAVNLDELNHVSLKGVNGDRVMELRLNYSRWNELRYNEETSKKTERDVTWTKREKLRFVVMPKQQGSRAWVNDTVNNSHVKCYDGGKVRLNLIKTFIDGL